MALIPPFSHDDECTCDRCQGIEWPASRLEDLQKFANELGPFLRKMNEFAQATALEEFKRVYAEHEAKKK